MTKTDKIGLIAAVTLLLAAALWRAWYTFIYFPYVPGCVVPEKTINRYGVDYFFQSYDIPDTIFNLMQGKSYKEDCTVAREDLQYLILLHRNPEGQAIVGEMVVNKLIATDVLDIMKILFIQSYPIEKVRLIDYYDADDEKSMSNNNTSCFNWRSKPNSAEVSKHGMGMAVDINPLYNPYYKSEHGRETVQPEAGRPYLDRESEFPYKITKNDLCHRLFTAHGFTWGGSWKSVKDYQHFEK